MHKKVMVFGTFDIFHKGHESFLKQARRYGDYLVVVIARDRTVSEVKKQKTASGERKRSEILKNSGLADKVVLGSLKDKYAAVRKYRPDVICLGYDQKAFVDDLENKLKELGLSATRIIRMKSYNPGKYKSSKLRKNM